MTGDDVRECDRCGWIVSESEITEVTLKSTVVTFGDENNQAAVCPICHDHLEPTWTHQHGRVNNE